MARAPRKEYRMKTLPYAGGLIAAVLALMGPAGMGSTAAHATVLTVGAGQDFATLAAAVAAASANDTIAIQAGTYTDQTATIDKPLTLIGVGGTPVFTATTTLANRKGFLVVNADTTVSNLMFTNAAVSDDDGANGAGIRYQGGNLLVTGSRFIGNQDGILATPAIAGTGSVIVRNSVFQDNGVATGPRAGFEHAIYATQLALLEVTDSQFEGTLIGHDIKSRAARTVVEGNVLDDGVSGTTSYAIDLANGGVGVIAGNTITQGNGTDNATMVSYAAEGLVWDTNSLDVTGNLFANSRTGASIGLYNHTAITAQVSCNAFNGLQSATLGPANLTDNVIDGAVPACTVPEPASLSILLAGSLGLIGLGRRRPG